MVEAKTKAVGIPLEISIAKLGPDITATLEEYLFKISDEKINELEIPTGNPLIIEFDNNLKIKRYFYLDETRAKKIIFDQ